MRAIVRAITDIISGFLSARVANLCKCCFSCYLRLVFSGIFENKTPFSIILLVELLSPYTHQDDFCNNILTMITKTLIKKLPKACLYGRSFSLNVVAKEKGIDAQGSGVASGGQGRYRCL
ncbi:hypothetical protein AVEN_110629-1 [Araneus ventricosus]|uniref:Uncharacterized protein n=1 Tax=Araneus ventricosus TaxID=182803 RepID=A0A4Y2AWP9_ARAVE|nr:hypothetical protein AVEN_110629-1 [Araneus ventricosus]